MRLGWVCLVFLLALLLGELTDAQRRNNRRRARNGVAVRGRSLLRSRIANGGRTNQVAAVQRRNAARRRAQPQARISTGNGNRNRNGNGNRNRNSNRNGNGNRVNNQRRRILNRSRNQLNQRRNRRANQSGKTKATARIIGGKEPRIDGGSSVSIASMPQLMQVLQTNGVCAGTLVNSSWVLTAAHCVQGSKAADFVVIGGTATQNGSDGVRSSVSSIHVAPNFNKRTMNRDAALLRLSSPMTGTNIQPIAIAQSKPPVGARVNTGGWGAIRENGNAVTNLRTVQLFVRSQKLCKQAYLNTSPITKSMFCASAPNRDTCYGDSGSGLYYNGRVVGIVSHGIGCARARYPGVYTNVAKLRSWISKTIAN